MLENHTDLTERPLTFDTVGNDRATDADFPLLMFFKPVDTADQC